MNKLFIIFLTMATTTIYAAQAPIQRQVKLADGQWVDLVECVQKDCHHFGVPQRVFSKDNRTYRIGFLCLVENKPALFVHQETDSHLAKIFVKPKDSASN